MKFPAQPFWTRSHSSMRASSPSGVLQDHFGWPTSTATERPIWRLPICNRMTWRCCSTPPRSGRPGGASGVRHFDHELAVVLAFEELEQRVRKRFQTLHDVLARLELAGGAPAGHFAQRFAIPLRIVEHQKALHPRAIDEQRSVIGRALDRTRIAVLRNRAADDHPRTARELSERGIEDVAADVVEIDIHAPRAMLSERFLHVVALVINRRVETEIVHEVSAFFRTPRDPNRSAALDLGDLSRHRAHRTGRARNNHGVARLRFADVEQAEIG